MELIKFKKEKGLCRIYTKGSTMVDFKLLKLELSETGDMVLVLNELRVNHIYNFIEKLKFHPNTWGIRISKNIAIKTKTTEYLLDYNHSNKKYILCIVDKKGKNVLEIDSFEGLEEELTFRLKRLEMTEFFELFYAIRTARCARHMFGTLISEILMQKIYAHRNIENLEKKMLDEEYRVEYSTVVNGYSVHYSIVGNMVLGIWGKDLNDSQRVEVVIETIEGINSKNREEKIKSLMEKQITILERVSC